MILFMEYSTGGRTGGELYQRKLHEHLKERLPELYPEEIQECPPELKEFYRHAVFALKRTRSLKPDALIVDVYSGCRNTLAVRWMKRKKRPVIVIYQGIRMEFRYDRKLVRRLARRCEKYLLNSADVIIVNSRYLAEVASGVNRRGAPIIVARPGVKITQFSRLGESYHEMDGQLINVLTLGECNRVKGTKYIIGAIGLLKDMNIHLDIAGKFDPERAYYRETDQVIEEYQIRDRITFHGYLDKDPLQRLFNKASIFAVPSLFEGYGIAIAEALSCGLPIVATRTGAIPELVEDGINGILVEPGDSMALAEAIRKLAGDAALCERMSRNNLKKSKSLPTWEDFRGVLDRELLPLLGKYTGGK